MKNKSFMKNVTGFLTVMVTVCFGGHSILAQCNLPVQTIPIRNAECHCEAGLGSACPPPQYNYYTTEPATICDARFPAGYIECRAPVQAIGHYYHCETEVDWVNAIAIIGIEAAACTAICIASAGTGCAACILAALSANDAALFTCIIWKCTVYTDGIYYNTKVNYLNRGCPEQG